MQKKTIKLSKKDRLEIKKKLSILMVKPFSLINDSSPTFGQTSRARIRRDPFERREVLVPFPYWAYDPPYGMGGTTQCLFPGLPLNSTMFSYEVVSERISRFASNARIPRRKFSFGNIYDGMFFCTSCEKYLTIYTDNRCSITVCLSGKMSNDPGWPYPVKRYVKITYSKNSNRLYLSTDIDNYSNEEMINFIRMVLFESLVY